MLSINGCRQLFTTRCFSNDLTAHQTKPNTPGHWASHPSEMMQPVAGHAFAAVDVTAVVTAAVSDAAVGVVGAWVMLAAGAVPVLAH